MKIMILVMIVLSVFAAGCSNSKQGIEDTTNQATNDIQAEIVSSSNKNEQDTTPAQGLFEKGYYDYEGTINQEMHIHMSIYPQGEEILGSYFYDTERKEIKLKGNAGVKDIVMHEYDETGKSTGSFTGTMQTVDKIEGIWISADNKKSYPFQLSLISIIPGAEYGKRYAVAVSDKSDKDVEAYVSRIQSLVTKGDKKQLVEEVSYPIKVNIKGVKTEILNKEEFIKRYDEIFHNKYKEAISNAFTKYMFVNWQGIMFGEGNYNMWINEIDSMLKITAINN